MPIVSSTHTIDAHQQASGARYVVERHTDNTGKVYQIGPWLAPAGFDVAGTVAARAVQIDEQLAEAEAEQVIEEN
jgi:hypothetical protein